MPRYLVIRQIKFPGLNCDKRYPLGAIVELKKVHPLHLKPEGFLRRINANKRS